MRASHYLHNKFLGFVLFRALLTMFILLFFTISSFSNSFLITAQNIGGGQKQIDATKSYNALTVGASYDFSFDVVGVNKPITVSDGTAVIVVSVNGSYTISFVASSSSHSFNFFHQSGGQPAKIEMDNVLLLKSEEITEISCNPASDDDYRFGFNGMEKDDEVKNGKGNHYNFGARCYDARLGRWLSLDPESDQFSFISPYSGMGNSPLSVVDPDGKKIRGVRQRKDGSLRYSRAAIKRGTKTYIEARMKTTLGQQRVQEMVDHKRKVRIHVVSEVFVSQTKGEKGKYSLNAGLTSSSDIVINTNEQSYEDIKKDKKPESKIKVAYLSNSGRIKHKKIKLVNLVKPIGDDHTENPMLDAYNEAMEESGYNDYIEENPIETDEAYIHSFGAHEETHWLNEHWDDNSTPEGLKSTEVEAYSRQVLETIEYNNVIENETKNTNDGGDKKSKD